MSKVNAPLLSFSAAGQIAKTQVYAAWKGRPYVRRYVVPSNPQSAGQTLTRNTFAWLNNVWKYMDADAQAAWTLYGSNNRFTNRNGWLKQNVSPLRAETDLLNIVMSPSVNGGPIAAGLAITPGSNQLTVDITAPTLPEGWTINKAQVLAIRDQDPQTETLYTSTYGEDATSTYQVVLTGLTASVLYVVGAWFQYQVSPTKLAYGLAITDTDTPTA